MADDQHLDIIEISIAGTSLDGEQHGRVRSCTIETSTELPDYIRLRMSDPHFELLDERLAKIGDQLEVKLRVDDAMRPAAAGEVTAVSVERGLDGDHELVLEALDATHRLHRGIKSRTFADMTDADITAQIAKENRLKVDADASGAVHDFVLQLQQTDFQLLAERARKLGFRLWVSGDTLHFKEQLASDKEPPPLVWGENLLDFEVRFSSIERCDEVAVRSFDALNKMELEATAPTPEPLVTAEVGAEFRDDARQAFGETRRFAGQFTLRSEAEAREVAEGLAMTTASEEVVLIGTVTGDPRIAAGARVSISNVGTRLAGTYLVENVEHRYSAGRPYVTRFWCGPRRRVGSGSRLARREIRPWGGLVLATVTDIADPEDLGRVKVKFSDLEQTDSAWAGLVTLGAGPERGIHFGHEVGDVVVVAFAHDDHQQPLVLGSLWNREDSVPHAGAVEGSNTVTRLLRTRDGHHLTFTDRDEGQIELALNEAEPQLVLEPSESLLHGRDALIVKADRITIEAGTELTLTSPSIKIEGSDQVQVSSKQIDLN